MARRILTTLMRAKLHIRVEGEEVVVATSRRRRAWSEWIAIAHEGRGRKVLAVGEPLETMQRYVVEAAPLRVELHRALSPETFDFEIAVAYLMYVIHDARRETPWWSFWSKPDLHFEHPRLHELGGRDRVALERFLIDSSRRLYVNGVALS